jgi:hypothetical protein
VKVKFKCISLIAAIKGSVHLLTSN